VLKDVYESFHRKKVFLSKNLKKIGLKLAFSHQEVKQRLEVVSSSVVYLSTYKHDKTIILSKRPPHFSSNGILDNLMTRRGDNTCLHKQT